MRHLSESLPATERLVAIVAGEPTAELGGAGLLGQLVALLAHALLAVLPQHRHAVQRVATNLQCALQ